MKSQVARIARRKFGCRNRHGAPLAAVSIALPAKDNLLAVESEQSVIGDRDPVGVAPEVS
jgi:hypothetical protein